MPQYQHLPIDTLNLDSNEKPLTYSSAKRGPDRLAWERAEAERITTNRHYPPHPTLPSTAGPVDKEQDRLLQPSS
jgi:hypothetical protein